ncbi:MULTISPECIES: hypothetical protein [Dehalobacter]|uniref:Uncharacterized protein n=2 Tax=Dehalobacter restrictus TaxID=55583 RepID=A0A857DFY9_9FIRM|nr:MULTISPECIES: hypothetical protein [Dehalobacter]AHF11227.1 hypothetical protein DEHRE_02020 [Dehalobacter restrictus DSM 9455]MCG1024965.1 hypothetical protein [Dehalobacter sp.]QGZ99557.1 hypothetical protein GQ588_02260 [Dehalobacter restrictus]
MDDQYLIATAIIDGENEEFFRKGKKEDFYLPKTYSEREIKHLQLEIQQFKTRIKNSFIRAGRIYSDDYSFLKNQIPEVLARLLEIELNMKINFYGQGAEFIYFSNESNYNKIISAYNEHFNF